MELGLSLGGDTTGNNTINNNNGSTSSSKPPGVDNWPDLRRPPGLDFGLCMPLAETSNIEEDDDEEEDDEQTSSEHTRDGPVLLGLPPRAAIPLRWSSENGSSGSSGNLVVQPAAASGFDVNKFPVVTMAVAEEVTSPNSTASTFPMDFSLLRGGGGNFPLTKKDSGVGGNDVVEGERGSSRVSDEDENGLNSRKKLRLSKEQSAFLEESFKERHTLNPKQKLALAKQLNLRPRQVEVWFQNRRARTKLKQTEVDCEYLKRCCETLTEENRKLHKELQELRALKASNPFHMQLPATTLTMCPSCERVATTSSTTTAAAAAIAPANATPAGDSVPKGILFPIGRPRLFPVAHATSRPHHQPAAS